MAFTVDNNGTAKRYRNGRLTSEQSYSADFTTWDSIYLGQRKNGNQNYKGLLEDIRIYDSVLSDSQIFELYQWGTRGKNLKEAINNYQSN